jgi:acyl carrier protein
MTADTSRLTEVLADMVADASDGEVTSGQVLTTRCPLPVLGIGSVAQIRLIDAIEVAFGVGIEPDSDVFYLGDVRVLADYLIKRGARAPGDGRPVNAISDPHP